MVNEAYGQRARKVTYPDPNNSDLAARNGMNISEAPVSVHGNDGGDKLGDAESDDQGDRDVGRH